MVGVMVFNTMSHLIYMGRWLGCTDCKLLYGSAYVSKAVVKGINMIFLIHRAKLAQGMSPVLSNKWFEKILSAFAGGIVIILIAATINSIMALEFICEQGNDWTFLTYCTRANDEDNLNNDNQRLAATLAIMVDVVICSFLMVHPTIVMFQSKLSVCF